MHPLVPECPEKTFVYFIIIEATPKEKYLKIGFAKDPKARLANLQTSSPLQMELLGFIEGDRKLEKAFHKMFGPLRRLNEWFLYTETAEAVISRLDFFKPPLQTIAGEILPAAQTVVAGSCLTFDTIIEHEGTHNTLGEWLCIRTMQDRSTWNPVNRKNQNV